MIGGNMLENVDSRCERRRVMEVEGEESVRGGGLDATTDGRAARRCSTQGRQGYNCAFLRGHKAQLAILRPRKTSEFT